MSATSGEFDLINEHLSDVGARRDDVELGVGDDAALLRPPGGASLCAASAAATCETDVETLAATLVAQIVRSLEAEGATPRWATLALSMPRADAGWLGAFAAALDAELRRADIALVGGDTTSGASLVLLEAIGTRAKP